MKTPNGVKANDIAWIYTLKKNMVAGFVGLLVFSIILAALVITMFMRKSLLRDSAAKTAELGSAVASSLRVLMIKRDPGLIQDAIDNIGENQDSIVRAFILDRTGRVAFSTDRREIGKVLDRFTDPSCRECHRTTDRVPAQATMTMKIDGERVQRNVKVIYNEPSCHECHPKQVRINGKLVIDRSLKQTERFIASMDVVVFGAGGVCLVLVIPFLLTRVNRYVAEILSKSREVKLLVAIANRLSRTIDIRELRTIAVDVVSETFDADEVHIIHPRDVHEFRVYGWKKDQHDLRREKIAPGSPLEVLLRDWETGSVNREVVSPDGRRLLMPIIRNNLRLALISIAKQDRPFEQEQLKFVNPVSTHLASGFENARLYALAISDELTRLYSLRYFRQCIEREIDSYQQNANPVALLTIDLDNFKRINDSYGHPVGDSVLKEAAQCILTSIRDNDLAFRAGGEEFTVILPVTNLTGGSAVAERVRECIEHHVFAAGAHNLHVTASIGVASCPEQGVTSKDLIGASDEALYEAKRAGKNRVVIGKKAAG